MKEFVLAFPLTQSPDAVWDWMIQNAWIPAAPQGERLHLKGIAPSFRFQIHPTHGQLVEIFEEHGQCLAPELERIAAHKSLVFLIGEVKDKATFLAVQECIAMFLRAGALGILFEHCGAAHPAERWLEEHTGESLLSWLNWLVVKKELRTLGMDVFSQPDLICALPDEKEADVYQNLLLDVAENLVFADSPMESGHFVQSDEDDYLLLKDGKASFSKGHAHYNPKGCLRLAKSKAN